MNPMISGTELALRFPTTAAKLVITCHQQGGDTRNAWDVLASAYGVREASNLVDLAGRAAGVDSVAVLASIGGVAEISDDDEPFEVIAAGTATVDDGGAVRLDIHPADEAGV